MLLQIFLGLAIGVGIGASISPYSLAQKISGSATPNIRAIIAANLESRDDVASALRRERSPFPHETLIFPPDRRVTSVEVSDMPQLTQTNFYGWAWRTCIRATVDDERDTFAIFILENRVIDARTAVIIDQCDKGNFVVVREQPLTD
jgi:hypothetical protein